ncbi:M20/M25/M40 family metallo-hydrolase [Sphingomonas sp. HITSZ_GF]|uniref:M20/M25/M40 family metallo-hydrolase n=1 Tax=Sphingomonas sp. HITSZ_GF TaxID=3037247 RepID=UPI00240D7238|nr:M20/M25/M40 family metallo-hydrolase [Sphingomonas sp. HITSZ_GF]MDG2534171.1 M20/M25/M40 family metallo-hydrolase [Sphingomonas sp. HITSZ_GF]
MKTLVRPAGWQLAALCLALLLVWTLRPIGESAPRGSGGAFDGARAVARLTTILGDQRPHPSGTPADAALLQRLTQQVSAMGFVPELDERFHCNSWREGAAVCARPRNLRFWVTAPGDDAIMIVAHHDSVPAGPGAADDGMGLATALELAYQLKANPPKRPVLVVITDAEEAGLVGAAAFAEADPLARRVGAVVNLEARGTTGRANMFQTSTPNGRDVAALAAGGQVPAANSLASDLYSILPNDTDLTALLPLGVDAANFAVIAGGKRYHTPLDNLANLDRATVQHMGDSALAAVRGFATQGKGAAEGQKLFVDLNGWLFLVLAKPLALGLMVIGFGASILLFVRTRSGASLRTAFAPLAALVAGVGLAIGITALIALLRSEADYATAYPWALRLTQGAAGLAGATLALRLLKVPGGVQLAAAAWAWLSALVLGLFAFIPGLSVLAAWPLLFLIAAAASSFVPRLLPARPWLMALAGVLFAMLALPVAAGFEDGLFPEHAAPIVLLLVLLLLFLALFRTALAWTAPGANAVLLALAGVAALLVPAFSLTQPRHLSIVHRQIDGKSSFAIRDNGALPPAMRTAASFVKAPAASDDPADWGKSWQAPAPAIAEEGSLDITADPADPSGRTLRLRASSPRADRQEFYFKQGERVRSVTVQGIAPKLRGPLRYIGCTGQSCRSFEVTLLLTDKDQRPDMVWRRTFYGAGPAAQTLVAARPATAQPVHVGDAQVIVRTGALTPPVAAAPAGAR